MNNAKLKYQRLCRRCGACCVLRDGTDCDHLQRLPDGRTKCKIYSKAMRGNILRTGELCLPLSTGPIAGIEQRAAPDCPYLLEYRNTWGIKITPEDLNRAAAVIKR